MTVHQVVTETKEPKKRLNEIGPNPRTDLYPLGFLCRFMPLAFVFEFSSSSYDEQVEDRVVVITAIVT